MKFSKLKTYGLAGALSLVCAAAWAASDICSEDVDSLIFPLFSPRHPAICLSRGVAPACPSKALAAFSMVVRVMPLPAIKDAWLIMLSLVSAGSINMGGLLGSGYLCCPPV